MILYLTGTVNKHTIQYNTILAPWSQELVPDCAVAFVDAECMVLLVCKLELEN